MSKKKKRRNKSKKAYRLNVKQDSALSIAQILLVVFALLVMVSFARQGVILVRVNDFLVELFSWTTIFLPFIFISAALLISKFRVALGQPNVLIGALVFFLSMAGLTRAGTFGISAWEAIAALITQVGAFIILLGTSIVGLIILFNTSFEQIAQSISLAIKYVRYYIFGEKALLNKARPRSGLSSLPRGQLKVIGGSDSDKKPVPASEKKEVLEEKLVSNVKGEDKVWKYPPISMLDDNGGGKAERGDIKGNAAVIEQTLESFGVTARVV